MRTVLEMLAGGGFVSGERISRELGISRTAVWKKIVALREEGWQIESGGKRGYRLLTGDAIDPALWAGALETRSLGRGTLRYAATMDSTNAELKRIGSEAPDGSIALCECQTAGRGRLGRAWSSPAGAGIWLSVLLKPDLPAASAPLITFCAALAWREAVMALMPADIRIKWPNDVIADGRKLCGILLELSAEPDRIEYVIVGTGLNVRRDAYPAELADRAVSLEELGAPPLRRELIVRYLAALEKAVGLVSRGGFAAVREAYTAASCTLGSRVRVSGAVEMTGVAEAVDDTGALLVRGEDGVLTQVLSGDVSVRGMMGYV